MSATELTPLESPARPLPDKLPRPCKHCAASARKRSCASSPGSAAAVFWNQSNPARQVYESWIGAKGVESLLRREGHQFGRAFFVSLFEPRERLIFFAE